ncbi:pyruvate kinase [Desulfobacteraceae bacterium SEEP-SAG9]|nr:pyruvate kinase [Desulfobacteraceae bacterium SEEP-SAG9]
MKLQENKTKIVCTIGPASESQEVMEKMLQAGMNVARLNFSHGDYESHGEVIAKLRAASRATGKRLAIMADLSGPKMRIGMLKEEPIQLKPGDPFTLTTEDIEGNRALASVSFDRLPQAVNPGDTLYLNDGYIQLEVQKVEGHNVHCGVLVGGELRSRKGLNLPDIDLGISAFTPRDHECLKFALEQGVDAVSQSFVESANDIEAVRSAAKALGHDTFIIAKIERSRAKDNLDGILDASDGIMVARGDLGVEIPIEKIALAQKHLMHLANLRGKPVITATQMLESMTTNRRPTRAEATDVANAILDGTDCVMLSGESAMGEYPVDAVAMLASIAATIEPHRPSYRVREDLAEFGREGDNTLKDLIALSVENALERVDPAAVIVPTMSGATARSITRFRLPVWIMAVSPEAKTCQELQFSYGVYPMHESHRPADWKSFAREWLRECDIPGGLVVMTEGPSSDHPEANDRMEIIDLQRE